eukprot:scaffold3450_cov114-Cylindrotheca_fusiformis.AAC.37
MSPELFLNEHLDCSSLIGFLSCQFLMKNCAYTSYQVLGEADTLHMEAGRTVASMGVPHVS